jgi:glyoxylase-like metal-dependent hydrolase (beta-lactamase superfamily II)
VLLTHLHADHACGLLDDEGKAAFPHATVWAARDEAAFWLDEKIAASMPEDKRPFFKLARDAVAPYVASGKFRTYGIGHVRAEKLGFHWVPVEFDQSFTGEASKPE